MGTVTANTYADVVKILTDYLGPASERFMDRQIEFHLGKNSKDLNEEDYKKLIEWIRTSLGLLTQDKKTVDEAVARIKKAV